MAGETTRRSLLVRAAHGAAMAPFFTLAACGLRSQETAGFELRGRTMGTTYRVRVAGAQPLPDRHALHAQVGATLRRIDQRMSIWRADAELACVNAAPIGSWVDVSEETRLLVAAALEQRRRSGGAYDPTVGALVDLWGFGPTRAPRLVPDPRRIDTLLGAHDAEALEVRSVPPGLRRLHPALRLDLGSIAQGYALDAIADLLDRHGVDHFLLELGGELRAAGQAEATRAWQVAVERPVGPERRPLCVVRLEDTAIGTSGVALHSFREGGRRYTHVLDPRTGRPVSHGLLAVSVIAPRALQADAEATTLLVLGPEAGLRRARTEGLPALFAQEVAGGIRITQTDAFRACVVRAGGVG